MPVHLFTEEQLERHFNSLNKQLVLESLEGMYRCEIKDGKGHKRALAAVIYRAKELGITSSLEE